MNSLLNLEYNKIPTDILDHIDTYVKFEDIKVHEIENKTGKKLLKFLFGILH